MSFSKYFPGRPKLRSEIQALKLKVEAQGLVIDDITTAQADEKRFRGNECRTYPLAIKTLAEMYEGRSEWGVLQTGSIVDVRASFIIGEGLKIVPKDRKKKDEAKAELEFAERFMDFNDLDREMAQEFAKEGELEGCFLGQLSWDEEAEMVSVRFRSRAKYDYTIVTDPKDYAWYKQATWQTDGTPTTLEEGDFVYGRFGGRVHQPNLPYPKVAKCISQIKALDKALRDWREINHLFAAPVPDVECADADQAQKMNAAMSEAMKNYRLRKLFIHTGKFSYVVPGTMNDALENEIITLAKMISGTTGTPVHFLGLPDLMSNRATADNLMELVTASTSKERQAWKGIYREMIAKAMAIWNANSSKTPLRPELLDVEIPLITQEQWQRITEVYLPLYQNDALSVKTLLSQVPGVDVEAEIEALAEREEEADKPPFSKVVPDDQDEETDDEKDEEEP